MSVAVELVGEESRSVEIDGATTYGDLLDPFDVRRAAVAILAEGQPVPADEPVPDGVDHVEVIRLVKGG